MNEELPEEFEDHTSEAMRNNIARLEAKIATMDQQMGMLMSCVKALAEGRKVIVHDTGAIFVQAPSVIKSEH